MRIFNVVFVHLQKKLWCCALVLSAKLNIPGKAVEA